MIKDVIYTISSNLQLNSSVFEMRLDGDTAPLNKSGQFIDIALSGKYLRRPISVCDYDEKGLTIIYKVVGEGTKQMSNMQKGEKLSALCALGNGFDDSVTAKKIALVGGGVGLPPLYGLAKRLKSHGKNITVLAGFNTAADMYYINEFSSLAPTRVATADGSAGTKGFVTALMDEGEFDYFYACGPEPMLNALLKTGLDGQLSYEARMACGFGVCMGCSCKTKLGAKRICKDGPVMTAKEMR